MNSEISTVDAPPSATSSKPAAPRRRVQLVLLATVAVVALSACNSDPGPGRVAEDIVNTSFVNGEITEDERDCMLERINSYSDQELQEIEKSAQDAGPGTALDQFEADLAACR